MRRVVITGSGIISCLGNNRAEVVQALKNSTSGIVTIPEFIEHGLRSHIAGKPNIDLEQHIDRRQLRFMGDAAAYSQIALNQAIEQAQLTSAQISNPRTGLIMGSGGASPHNQIEASKILQEKGVRRIGPYQVTRTMGSTVSACLATNLQIRGVSYSITSACATSAHCIGAAMQQIQFNLQDVMFAGGGEELSWELAMLFDGMGALSTKYNHSPTTASRPYDASRDGFIIAGGAGALVLESLEHAQARGANILAEIIGYAATSDGADMVAPSGNGAIACMQQALKQANSPIDYINTHGTSTPIGDSSELNAMRAVFGTNVPAFSSTKSLTGHSQGATGVQEAIYSLWMLQDNFIAGSANVSQPDPAAQGLNLVTESYSTELTTVMSNSFGFGGTNACLVLQKFVE